ncbi:hypothetical protein [Rhodoblastus sp.]|uniref:hypothetical protein n=1 Tax=Rhodoblastus sp. TaxID=1962975 RepID=UPI003F95B4B4
MFAGARPSAGFTRSGRGTGGGLEKSQNKKFQHSLAFVLVYAPLPNPTTIWDDEDGAANANIPFIPASLTACASPGFFFTASTPADIANAMQTMFNMALASAHLTQ